MGWFSHWVSNVVHTAGRAVHSAAHAVSSVSGKVTNAVSKVPLIGKGLHAIVGITLEPFNVAADIASGARLDHVALHTFKNQIADIHEIAPYAQMVISEVPGLGTGISGAIGASLALANGKPITEALETGLKDGLPGGPLAQSIFSVSTAVMAGKSIDSVAISALPIDDSQKRALAEGLKATRAIASGANLSKLALKEAKDNLSKAVAGLPPEIAKSLKTGIAVGNAIKLQNVVKKEIPNLVPTLINIGSKTVAKNDILKEASRIIPNGKTGFLAGTGLMQHQIKQSDLLAVRSSLSAANKKGFDTALSTHVGLVTNHKINLPPAAAAGFYTTMGMRGADQKQKVAIMKAISRNPKIKEGAKHAINRIDQSKNSWWYKVKEFLGVA